MKLIEKRKILHGWATIHRIKYRAPMIYETFSNMTVMISQRPTESIEMFSPSGRLVSDAYFHAFPLVGFRSREVIRVLCALWRHTAVIRYWELHGPFFVETFLYDHQGTSKLNKWMESIVRNEARKDDRVRLQRNEKKRYELVSPKDTYPSIRRWSFQAIASAHAYKKRMN